jgi:hypothetical protein
MTTNLPTSNTIDQEHLRRKKISNILYTVPISICFALDITYALNHIFNLNVIGRLMCSMFDYRWPSTLIFSQDLIVYTTNSCISADYSTSISIIIFIFKIQIAIAFMPFWWIWLAMDPTLRRAFFIQYKKRENFLVSARGIISALVTFFIISIVIMSYTLVSTINFRDGIMFKLLEDLVVVTILWTNSALSFLLYVYTHAIKDHMSRS